MSFLRLSLLAAGVALLLSACGTRGPLVLPPAKSALADHTSSPTERPR